MMTTTMTATAIAHRAAIHATDDPLTTAVERADTYDALLVAVYSVVVSVIAVLAADPASTF